MNIVEQAEKAFALMREAREAVQKVASALNDSKSGIAQKDKDQLVAMLHNETQESRVAHDSLRAAINKALGQ